MSVRVPIGPRRKKACESCGKPIKQKGQFPSGPFPYPQILNLNHRDLDGQENRGSRQYELCRTCMDEIAEAINQWLPDWQPVPVQYPPWYPWWMR